MGYNGDLMWIPSGKRLRTVTMEKSTIFDGEIHELNMAIIKFANC
jgi:hypothetical protein